MGDSPGGHVEDDLQSSVRQDAQGDVEHEGGDSSGQAGEARHSDEDVGDRSEDRAEDERHHEKDDPEHAEKGLQDRVKLLLLEKLLPLAGYLTERARPLTGPLRGLADLLDHPVGGQAHGVMGLALPQNPVHAGPHEAAIAVQAAGLLIPLLREGAKFLGVRVTRGDIGRGHEDRIRRRRT
ncbi:hypothetical protein ACFYL6_20245 [Micromonospora sp. NPDC007208]|uniref:hypothetical protein n=1 Tax=Micromonospora sp. NPDC007208 TaxID=3364236 RepID=UPI0036978E67